MRFIMTALMIGFVGLVLGLALTFGLALIVWMVALALVFSGAALLREQYYRWRRGTQPMPPPGPQEPGMRQEPPKVIEGEFREIKANEKEDV